MTYVSEVQFYIDASSGYYPDNLDDLFADEVGPNPVGLGAVMGSVLRIVLF